MNERQGKHTVKTKKRRSVAALIALDLTAIAAGLLIFALFHHVLPHYGILGGEEVKPVVLVTLAPQPTPQPTPAPQQAESPEETSEPEPEPERVYSGMWGEKFADKFTDGEVIRTENSYRSANINVSYERIVQDDVIYFVADVYVSDLGYLRSGFANDKYNGGFRMLGDMAADAGAVVALSGDHYAGRSEGIVVRNGDLWRETRFADVCVLLSDGTMVTLTNAELDLDDLKAAKPWQVWSFGPELLDDEGKALTSFNSVVLRNNPRAAIGYVEPGHYYLVEVEGTRTGYYSGSRGMKMEELAQLFESLGCKSAYNLDGGQSVGFAWMGELVSFPYDRSIPDMIYVADFLPGTETEGEG